MTLTLTVANATDATRLVNDFCSATRYDPASGLTKSDWVRKYLSDYLKQIAKQGEVKDTAVVIKAAIDAIVIT